MKKRPGGGFLISLLIAFAALIVYLPALRNGFVNWDDAAYVYQNPFIRSINIRFFKFAFGFHFANWHPVTWLSHALDYSVWRLDPFGHHLTNIILHSFNSLIVTLLTVRLLVVSKDRRRNNGIPHETLKDRTILMAGGVTGLLFGLHPLHVESVVWVAERKDLLCAFFFLLSIMAYLKYRSVLDGGKPRTSLLSRFHDKEYLLSIGLFVLALMSKPMAVSLPFVLLIVDWYPFRRIRSVRTCGLAVLEKAPFFVLSLLSAIVTVLAQRSAGAIGLIKASLWMRALVAGRGVVFYLWKMVLPFNLVPYYPYPKVVSFRSPEYLSLAVLLIGIPLVCVFAARKRRLFLAAWGYYVVTLLPVLGIVQVGLQSMADRYTYLPSIGPFLVFGVTAAIMYEKWRSSRRSPIRRSAFLLLLSVVFVFFSCLTVRQTGLWKNSVVFWKYVIKEYPGKICVAHFNLGEEYQSEGAYDLAAEQYKAALRVNPATPPALINLGNVYEAKGFPDKAIQMYRLALKLRANNAKTYNNLGVAYQAKGLYDMAVEQYKISLRLNPDDAKVHSNLGDTYRAKGMSTKAVEQYKISLQLNPGDAKVHSNLGDTYRAKGMSTKAVEQYLIGLKLDPDNVPMHVNLGNMFFSRGLYKIAIRHYRKALELKPDFAEAHGNLGVAYAAEGLRDKAIDQFKIALRLKPHYARVHYYLGKVYLEKKETDLARKEFESALRSKPGYTKARDALREIISK